MATAEEILQEMEAEVNAPVLTIDNDLRTIAIPDDVAILGVESDDDVHRLRFRMPKMCGEFDLSAFKLRVNILNAQNEGDLYEVKDNAVEGDAITFSWLVGRTAAKYKGDVKFNVCAKLMDKDGVVQKEFNTTPAKLPVLEGLEVSEAVVQLHPDIIEGMLARIAALETSGGVSDEQIANALSAYLQEHPIEAGATKEQAAQIQKNKEDIEDLKKNGTGSGDPAGTASAAVNEHNTDDGSHEDIRQLISGLSNRLNALADSDDKTLDQLSEIVTYIKSNKSLIDQITTGKVSTSDIVDNLVTNVSTKVLSAAQGVKLKALIDAIVIPTSLPNPQPIVINGESYDGSVKKEITIQPDSSTGGAEIDDTTPSASTTYSSEKIEAELNELNEKNAQQDNRLTTLEQAGGISSPMLGELKCTAIYPCSTIYLDGNTTGMTKDVSVMLDILITDEYGNEFFRGKSETSWQGSGSLSYPNKNLSIKLQDAAGEKAKIKVFPDYATNAYHLKCNYLDYSMVRNSVGAQLAHDFDDTVFPVDAPITVKSIPVIVYLNGAFNGCYTLNYKQDDKLFGMDTKTNPLTEIVYRSGLGTWSQGNFEYRGDADETADMKAKLQMMMDFAANSDDVTFAAEFENHFDLNNAINYWLYADIACATDSMINNWTVATWDGAKWYMCWYDLDIIFGLMGTGNQTHPNAPETDLLTLTYTTNNPIWAKLYRCFYEQIRTRYWELRDEIANPTKLVSRFRTFQTKWSAENIKKDRAKWTGRPNTNKDVDNMYAWMVSRFAVLDAKYGAGIPEEPDIPDEPDVPDTPTGEHPTGYTRVEYIQSDGTQTLMTGVNASDTIKIIADFNCAESNVGRMYFGAYNSGEQEDYRLFYVGNIIYLDVGSGRKTVNMSSNVWNGHRNVVEFGNAYAKLHSHEGLYNDVTISGEIQTADAIAANEICVFGDTTKVANMKLYSFVIYDGDVKIRDFIPVQTKDGVVGMYDLINNRLYSNDSSKGENAYMCGDTVYTVTNNSVEISVDNDDSLVTANQPYITNLTASGKIASIDGVTVTMGGEDVTSSVYADGVINIPSVTGDIVITGSVFYSIDMPAGYTALNYIESDGTQALFTGVNASDTLRIVADLGIPTEQVTGMYFGAPDSLDTEDFRIMYSGNVVYFDLGTSRISISNMTADTFAGHRNVIEVGNNFMTLTSPEGLYDEKNASGGAQSSAIATNEINLFGRSVGQDKKVANMKVYSFTMYNGETKVRDFYPFMFNGVAGLYDVVAGEFYVHDVSAGENAYKYG